MAHPVLQGQTIINWTIEDPDYTPAQATEILARRAHELARPLEQPPEGNSLDLLTFQLGGERYGLNVTQVLEIYPLQPLTPVPRTPSFVVGFFSARGRFISVVDLPSLLGRSVIPATAPISPESSLVVVSVNDLEVAFLADVVDDVQTVFENELEPPLAVPYTRGIAPGMTAVLDLHTLFNRERLIINEET